MSLAVKFVFLRKKPCSLLARAEPKQLQQMLFCFLIVCDSFPTACPQFWIDLTDFNHQSGAALRDV